MYRSFLEIPYSQEGVRRQPHGLTESGAPEKYPKAQRLMPLGPELRERRVGIFWGIRRRTVRSRR